ncbi:phosphatase PAP2 family protein [Marinibacterium sp. SX1]|uniref:phosphatase PAP2 family protein n=1 Tax=Marinibacterium sp. SX1 TaxID=3388424 RepID=UPI003D1786A0
MPLAPFGVLSNNNDRRLAQEVSIVNPMPGWKGSATAYRALVEAWLADVTDRLWPAWVDGAWQGGAAASMDEATRRELELAVALYHGQGGTDILDEVPDIPPAPDGKPRTQKWHFDIEDALVLDLRFRFVQDGGEPPSFDFRASNGIAANYLVYDPTDQQGAFAERFFARMDDIEPSTVRIKQHLQRPRPWSAAVALGVDGFRWTTAGHEFASHTGIHPSMISGHCIQGILGGCAVYDAWLGEGQGVSADRRRAMQKYMVDFGDRRVFAGVHYMTDNIASWTLARRIIPHLFTHADEVEAFAVEALTTHSRVFADILAHFDPADPAREMLLAYYPEAAAPA